MQFFWYYGHDFDFQNFCIYAFLTGGQPLKEPKYSLPMQFGFMVQRDSAYIDDPLNENNNLARSAYQIH
jgi:hypothetical protein